MGSVGKVILIVYLDPAEILSADGIEAPVPDSLGNSGAHVLVKVECSGHWSATGLREAVTAVRQLFIPSPCEKGIGVSVKLIDDCQFLVDLVLVVEIVPDGIVDGRKRQLRRPGHDVFRHIPCPEESGDELDRDSVAL